MPYSAAGDAVKGSPAVLRGLTAMSRHWYRLRGGKRPERTHLMTEAGVTPKARAMFACEPYRSKSACISGVMAAEFTPVNWVLTEVETSAYNPLTLLLI